VARCLEYDICAQANDPEQVSRRLVATIRSEYGESMYRHGKPFAGIDRAPDHFYDLWKRRSTEFKPKSPTPITDLDIDVEFGIAA
jgi:hypothetical protein